MNTKLIMMLSAAFLAFTGMGLTFFPQEIAVASGLEFTKAFQLILQILGALFFAFAMLNWMAKGSIIGGIYNRPIVLANLAHFFIGGLALIKALMGNFNLPSHIWILAVIYSVFTVLFGILFSRHPSVQS